MESATSKMEKEILRELQVHYQWLEEVSKRLEKKITSFIQKVIAALIGLLFLQITLLLILLYPLVR